MNAKRRKQLGSVLAGMEQLYIELVRFALSSRNTWDLQSDQYQESDAGRVESSVLDALDVIAVDFATIKDNVRGMVDDY